MEKKFVTSLIPKEKIKTHFLVSKKKLRTTRPGSLYLDLELQDRTGRINAKFWDATDRHVKEFETEDILLVTGRVELYKGRPQIIVESFKKEDEEKIDIGLFLPKSKFSLEDMFDKVTSHLSQIENEHLSKLINAFLSDEKFCKKFKKAPAATNFHHAHIHGLLEHVMTLLNLAENILPFYKEINKDLLKTGIFLHDIGKIEELSYKKAFQYTDRGKLEGHISIGLLLLEDKAKTIQDFPNDLLTHLRHMILSHHGAYEWGAPVLPKTAEAVVLHYLDNLDAKIIGFQKTINESVDKDSNWTIWSKYFGGELFKGKIE